MARAGSLLGLWSCWRDYGRCWAYGREGAGVTRSSLRLVSGMDGWAFPIRGVDRSGLMVSGGGSVIIFLEGAVEKAFLILCRAWCVMDLEIKECEWVVRGAVANKVTTNLGEDFRARFLRAKQGRIFKTPKDGRAVPW